MFVSIVQVKKAQTLTEKILARHSNNASVVPGQNIWTNVDKLMTHDVCGPGTFGIFQREFGENAQVRVAPSSFEQQVYMLPGTEPLILALYHAGVGPRKGGHHPGPLHLHL